MTSARSVCALNDRHFEVKNRDDPTEAAMLFSVPDFVGDACKAIASRVRGSVASVQFDDFHKVLLCSSLLLTFACIQELNVVS
jgi:Shoulder domain